MHSNRTITFTTALPMALGTFVTTVALSMGLGAQEGPGIEEDLEIPRPQPLAIDEVTHVGDPAAHPFEGNWIVERHGYPAADLSTTTAYVLRKAGRMVLDRGAYVWRPVEEWGWDLWGIGEVGGKKFISSEDLSRYWNREGWFSLDEESRELRMRWNDYEYGRFECVVTFADPITAEGEWTVMDQGGRTVMRGSETWSRFVPWISHLEFVSNVYSRIGPNEVGQVEVDWVEHEDPMFSARIYGEGLWGHHIIHFGTASGLQSRESQWRERYNQSDSGYHPCFDYYLLPRDTRYNGQKDRWGRWSPEPSMVVGVEVDARLLRSSRPGLKEIVIDGQRFRFDLRIQGHPDPDIDNVLEVLELRLVDPSGAPITGELAAHRPFFVDAKLSQPDAAVVATLDYLDTFTLPLNATNGDARHVRSQLLTLAALEAHSRENPPPWLTDSFLVVNVLGKELRVDAAVKLDLALGEPSIVGLWRDTEDGSTLRFEDHNGDVRAYFVEPSAEDATERGFKADDRALRLRWRASHEYAGARVCRLPLEAKDECPDVWEHEVPLELRISPDGQRLDGTWEQRVYGPNCDVMATRTVRIALERVVAQESTDLDEPLGQPQLPKGDRDGDLGMKRDRFALDAERIVSVQRDPDSGKLKIARRGADGRVRISTGTQVVDADGTEHISEIDEDGRSRETTIAPDGTVQVSTTDSKLTEHTVTIAPDGSVTHEERSLVGVVSRSSVEPDGSFVTTRLDSDGQLIETIREMPDGWRERTDRYGNIYREFSDTSGLKTTVEVDRSGNTTTTIRDAKGTVIARDQDLVAPREPGRDYYEQVLSGTSWDELPDSLKTRFSTSEREMLRVQEAEAAREKRKKILERRQEIEGSYEVALELQQKYDEAVARGDKDAAMRIMVLQDAHHEASTDLLLPTPEESEEMDRRSNVRSELANRLNSRAHVIASQQIGNDDAWQDAKESITDKTKWVSLGSQMQQSTARSTRMADHELAFASAKQQEINRLLGDSVTTPEQREMLLEMREISHLQEDGARRLLDANGRITTAGYVLDGALLFGGGLLAKGGESVTAKVLGTETAARVMGHKSAATLTAALTERGVLEMASVGTTRTVTGVARQTAGEESAMAIERLLTTDVSSPVTQAAGAFARRTLGDTAVEALDVTAGRIAAVARTDLGDLARELRARVGGQGSTETTVLLENMTAAQRQAYYEALMEAERRYVMREAPRTSVVEDLPNAEAARDVKLPSRMSRVERQAYNDERVRRAIAAKQSGERIMPGSGQGSVARSRPRDLELKRSEAIRLHQPGRSLSRSEIAEKAELYSQREAARLRAIEAHRNSAPTETVQLWEDRYHKLDDLITESRSAARRPTSSSDTVLSGPGGRKASGLEPGPPTNPPAQVGARELTVPMLPDIEVPNLGQRVWASVGDDHRLVELHFGDRVGGGSFNEVYRAVDPVAGEASIGRVYRVSNPITDKRPRALSNAARSMDDAGREALAAANPEILKSPQVFESYNIVDRSLAARRVELLEELRGLESLPNSRQAMTPGQALAYEMGTREINRLGHVWLDNHSGQFAFERLSTGSDRWRLCIYDPGGIVPVRVGIGDAAAVARRLQAQINAPADELVREVADAVALYRLGRLKKVLDPGLRDALDFGRVGVDPEVLLEAYNPSLPVYQPLIRRLARMDEQALQEFAATVR